MIDGSVRIGISVVSLVVRDVVVSSISQIIGAHRASEAPIVERPWYELWLSRLSRLAALLLQDVVKQFLASSYLDGAVFEVFIRSYLGSFYYILKDGLWEAFEEKIGYFHVAHCVSCFVAQFFEFRDVFVDFWGFHSE